MGAKESGSTMYVSSQRGFGPKYSVAGQIWVKKEGLEGGKEKGIRGGQERDEGVSEGRGGKNGEGKG